MFLLIFFWLLLMLGKSWTDERTSVEMHVQCKEYTSSGLLDTTCMDMGLTRVPKLANASNIKQFSLERNKITILEPGDFDDFPSLIRLELLFNQVREIKAGVFNKLANLKELYLGYNEIYSIEKGAFAGLHSLRFLSLGVNKLTRLHAGMFSGLPNLQKLWLGRNEELSEVEEGSFDGLSSLKSLDLASVNLTTLKAGVFSGLRNLQQLMLSSNGITSVEDGTFDELSSLVELDLGFNRLTAISAKTIGALGNLTKLWLYSNKISSMQSGSFHGLTSLKILDLRKNSPKMIGPNAFYGLPSNLTVYSDNSDFCCIVRDSGVSCQWPSRSVYWLDGYEFVVQRPIVHQLNLFSSCRDLMHNKTLRFFIWMLGIFAVVCNVSVISWRLLSRYRAKNKDINENQRKSNLLSICLAFGDLCMGIFLLIIGTADQVFRGYYVFQDEEWRRSSWCSLAGFLSAFSSEFTVFILTMITIDRYYAIAYPTRRHILDSFCVMIIVVLLFIVSALLAAAPLMTGDLPNFYNVSGVCLALPFIVQHGNSTQESTLQMTGPSWNYSFSVFIGLNSISVLVIVVCYAMIFIHVMKSKKSTTNTAVNTEARIGHRIMMIIGTDMACWLPIILLGLLSAVGYGLPPTVYAWVAVFVLPINSAINPLIYTFYTRQFQQAVTKAWLRLKSSSLWSSKGNPSRTVDTEMKKHYSRVTMEPSNDKELIMMNNGFRLKWITIVFIWILQVQVQGLPQRDDTDVGLQPFYEYCNQYAGSDGPALQCDFNNSSKLPAFRGAKDIFSLNIIGSGLTSLVTGTFIGLDSLQSLSLNYNQINEVEVGAFEGLSSLKKLYLNYNKLTVIKTGLFEGLLNLEELELTHNHISVIQDGAFRGLLSVKRLDLAWNRLNSLVSSHFNQLDRLEHLCLHKNEITHLEDGMFHNLPSLNNLILSENKLTDVVAGVFAGLKLAHLNLNKNLISYIGSGAFEGSLSLQSIDLRANNLKVILPGAFRGLHPNLSLFTTDPNVCCIASYSGISCTTAHRDFHTYALREPIAPVRNVDTTFSSCLNLMHRETLRIFIWVQGIVAVVFNVAVILWRLLSKSHPSNDRRVQETQRKSTLLFICLAFGDICMGVFLLIVAVADQVFRGYYILQDEEWKQSLWCSFAGFLSAFSSESTVFLLSLITFDRFYTLLYPARALSWFFVFIAAVFLLVLSAILAAVPFMTTDLAEFYNQSGVCLALPFITDGANGSTSSAMAMSTTAWKYSFSVFIGINTVSVAVIIICYIKIFIEATRSKKSTTNTSGNRAVKMGERILMIVVTDMACWLPVIILGIVSACGLHLSTTVYAWVAVFVLPVNSAINPLIYTFYTRQFKQNVTKLWMAVNKVVAKREPSSNGGTVQTKTTEA